METKEVGIETLKEVAKATAELAMDIDKKSEGGISLMEGLSIGVNAFDDVLRLSRKGKEIKAEWEDRTDEEREELVEYFINEFDLESDRAEKITEKCLKVIAAFDELLAEIRQGKKETVEQ
jgi:hypothetical protein